MATTFLKPLHAGKGRSIAQALGQSADYVKNPDKTDNGEWISDYQCNPSIVDAEFLFSKRQYAAQTGKTHKSNDVIAYHLRQSFKPEDFEAFLRMLEEYGHEVKRGKNIALKGKGQQRFIRLRSLGEGYSEEEIRAVIAGAREHQPKRRRKEKQFSAAPLKLQLLIDIEAKRAQGKGGGYVRWAKNFNLQQMAEAVCFIKEHDIGTYDELVEKTDAATTRFNELSDFIKSAEQRLVEIAALKKHIINYSRTKEIYATYKKSGYSKTFLEEHREEITLHKAAKAAFNQIDSAGGQRKRRAKIPTIKQLNQEYAQVLSGKKAAYAEYREARKQMQDYLISRKNIEAILDVEQEQEEQRRQQEQHNTDR